MKRTSSIICRLLFSLLPITFAYPALPIETELKATPQNANYYLSTDNQYDVTRFYEKKLKHDYLAHYFAPWQHHYTHTELKNLLAEQQSTLDDYRQKPGWDENYRHHDFLWIKTIAQNMDFRHFANAKERAITINATALRVLPTITPSFGNPKKAGQGFPFDKLQISFLSPNLPLFVIQSSKDGAWKLVLTNDHALGWVESKDIAAVNTHFMQAFIPKHHHFVTITTENQPVSGKHHHFYFLSRIDELLPLYRTTKNNYEVLVAVKNSADAAVLRQAWLPKKFSQPWPIALSSKHICQIANQFLGETYGWGGLYGYRDCSATLRDLFEPFGVWLPRSSELQAETGEFHSLHNLSAAEKAQTLIKSAIPFYTLLWLKGHILLYIGHKGNEIFAYHSPWALHSKSLFLHQEGRMVIGRTVITSLDLGHDYLTVPKTWLQELIGYTYIIPSKDLKKLSH